MTKYKWYLRKNIIGAWATSLLVFLITCVLLVISNLKTLSHDVTPSGDIAYDMLLIETAQDGPLLTGHFSRYGFNHPGPFFFDLRLIFQKMLGAWLPSPYNAHFLAVQFGSALFLAIAAFALYRLFDDGRTGGLRATALGTAILLCVLASHNLVAGSWMPEVLPPPFATFTLLLVALACGRTWAMVPAVFCGGVLVHGYVTMPVFVLGAFLPALSLGWYQNRRAGTPFVGGRELVVSGVVVAIFLLPMMVDALAHKGGNIAAIVGSLQTTSHFPRPGIADSLHHSAQFWRDIPWPVWGGAAAALAQCVVRRERLGMLATSAAVLAVISVLFVTCVLRSPDLYPARYTGYFYIGAILIPAILAICASADLVFRQRRWSVLPFAALLVLLIVPKHGFTILNDYLGDPQVREISQKILEDVDGRGLRRTDTTVGFTFDDPKVLAANNLIAGLLVDLGRFGVRSCIEMPWRALAYTARRICRPRSYPNEATLRYEVTLRPLCGDECTGTSDQWGLIPISYDVSLGSLLDFRQFHTRRLLGVGWSWTEPWGVWTDGPRAELYFRVLPDARRNLLLSADVRAFQKPGQSGKIVRVWVNGRLLAEWRFTPTDPSGVRSLIVPAELAAQRQPLGVTFEGLRGDPPATFRRTDRRRLGLGISWLRIEEPKAGSVAP